MMNIGYVQNFKCRIIAMCKNAFCRGAKLLLYLPLAYCQPVNAQESVPSTAKEGQQRIDSLMVKLQTAKDDTNKANLLNDLSGTYFRINPDEGLRYAHEALQLCQQLGWKKGMAKSFELTGLNFFGKEQTDSALAYYDRSLKMNRETGNREAEADNYNSYGLAYLFWSDYPTALDYFFKALKINEAVGSKIGITNNLVNIGLVYHSMSNLDMALSWYKKGHKAALQAGNKLKAAIVLNNIGVTYRDTKNYQLATNYLQQAYGIYEELGVKGGMVLCLYNMGLAWLPQRNYAKAMEYYRQALAITNENPNEIYSCIGDLYLQFAKDSLPGIKEGLNISRKEAANRAIFYLKKASENFKLLKKHKELIYVYDGLSQSYRLAGNYYQALVAHELYVQYRDSVFNDENFKKVGRLEAQVEYEKKQLADSLLNAEANKVAALKLKRQLTLTNASIAVGLLLLALSIVVYFYYKQLAVQKRKSERLRLSRDLHDDIGSTLSSIGMYGKIAIDKLQGQQTDEVLEVLGKMNVLSHNMTEKMNDLVWNINPDNDSLEQTADRMKVIAARMLQPQDITYSFNSNSTRDTISLTIDQRKNLLLLFKEALNNIVKYADCKTVDIELRCENNSLLLSVKDDGVGFDTKQGTSGKPGGNGIKNMQARMEQLNGSFLVNSENGKGTTIACSFPL